MGNTNNFFSKLVSKTKIYLVIIAILLLIICILKPVMIIPCIVVYILILMYAYSTNRKELQKFQNIYKI